MPLAERATNTFPSARNVIASGASAELVVDLHAVYASHWLRSRTQLSQIAGAVSLAQPVPPSVIVSDTFPLAKLLMAFGQEESVKLGGSCVVRDACVEH